MSIYMEEPDCHTCKHFILCKNKHLFGSTELEEDASYCDVDECDYEERESEEWEEDLAMA